MAITLANALYNYNVEYRNAISNKSKRKIEKLDAGWQQISNYWDIYLQAKAEGESIMAADAIIGIVAVLGGSIDTSILPVLGTGAVDAEIKIGFTTTVDGITIPKGTTILAGTLLEDIWKAELAPYVSPLFTSFLIGLTPNLTYYEVGAIVNVDDATVAADNDSEGNPPSNIFIAGVGFNKAGIVGVTTANPLTTVQKTDDQSEIWTVTGEDKDGNPIPNDTYIKNWRYRHYFGGNATILDSGSSDSEVQAVLDLLQDTDLRAGRSRNITCGSYNENTSNYTYIMYASKYGDLSNVILNGAAPVLGAFTRLGIFNITNGEGQVVTTLVYKSNATGAFDSGDTLQLQ